METNLITYDFYALKREAKRLEKVLKGVKKRHTKAMASISALHSAPVKAVIARQRRRRHK